MNLYKMCYHFKDEKDFCFVCFEEAKTAKQAAENFRQRERNSPSDPKRILESVKLVNKGDKNG